MLAAVRGAPRLRAVRTCVCLPYKVRALLCHPSHGLRLPCSPPRSPKRSSRLFSPLCWKPPCTVLFCGGTDWHNLGRRSTEGGDVPCPKVLSFPKRIKYVASGPTAFHSVCIDVHGGVRWKPTRFLLFFLYKSVHKKISLHSFICSLSSIEAQKIFMLSVDFFIIFWRHVQSD